MGCITPSQNNVHLPLLVSSSGEFTPSRQGSTSDSDNSNLESNDMTATEDVIWLSGVHIAEPPYCLAFAQVTPRSASASHTHDTASPTKTRHSTSSSTLSSSHHAKYPPMTGSPYHTRAPESASFIPPCNAAPEGRGTEDDVRCKAQPPHSFPAKQGNLAAPGLGCTIAVAHA